MKRPREYPHPVLKLLLNIERHGECWEWTLSTQRNGYGQISHNGKRIQAHRYAYQLRFGPVPEGLVLDHLCRNKRCVNPEHLEPVTNRENILRGESPIAIRARTNHCKRGHELTAENIILVRVCRVCSRARDSRYKRMKRSAHKSKTAHRS
jgi:hypothetical protein